MSCEDLSDGAMLPDFPQKHQQPLLSAQGEPKTTKIVVNRNYGVGQDRSVTSDSQSGYELTLFTMMNVDELMNFRCFVQIEVDELMNIGVF